MFRFVGIKYLTLSIGNACMDDLQGQEIRVSPDTAEISHQVRHILQRY